MAEVRAESPRDSAAVFEVNRAAFGRLGEAVALVDVLRDCGASLFSMVAAMEDGEVLQPRLRRTRVTE